MAFCRGGSRLPFFSVVLLGLAVSFDGFGAGFAYGVRKVHIPLVSLVIICLFSSFAVFLSMKVGVAMATLFSAQFAALLGGLVLVAVGTMVIYQTVCQEGKESRSESPDSDDRGLKLLSCVRREPTLADFDSSGTILGREAMILGAALAMDTFAAGLGAAMMGLEPLSTALTVGLMLFIMFSLGILFGRHNAEKLSGESAAIISGLVLIMLGFIRFFSH
jgi:putative sporulation protein YtaF